MENTGKTNTRKKSTSTKTTAKKTTATKFTTAAAKPKAETNSIKNRLRINDVDLRELVEVQNCTGGALYYEARDGHNFTWNEFGETQMLPVEDLLQMRNQQPKFYQNQWIKIVGDNAADVINFLQVERYYMNIVDIDNIDEVFDYEPEELRSLLGGLSSTLKEAIARRAYQKVQDGSLNALSTIKVINEVTGYDISEKE